MADDPTAVSRRRMLKATGGAFGIAGLGAPGEGDGDHEVGGEGDRQRCPEATIEPAMEHYDPAGVANCADDHPRTKQLQRDVHAALEDRYPTVGALIDEGFVPYFDFLAADEEGGGGWSHWLNPEFIGDDSVLDPERPESVLVDHRWWRPIGVMFIATRDGERVDPPPAVYGDGSEDGRENGSESGSENGGQDGNEGGDEAPCRPWHAHVGVPGRYSWWKYQALYGDGPDSGSRLPCRTPWMLHVWVYPHPESVYAHGAPPRGSRGGPPAEPAGFDTAAVPGEDDLDASVLPDVLRRAARR